jgi:pimeloyl-ACP methyl ester carboxylesterase
VLTQFTTRDGLSLSAETAGDSGRPVLLLHGGGQTRHAWQGTAAALAAAGWEAVAIDLRGHGDSEWSPDGEYRLEDFAADVQDVVAQLAASPVLVGASLGGLASLLALADEPVAEASGLVLVDVAHRYELGGANRVVDFMRGTPEGFADPSEAAAAVARYLPHRRAPEGAGGIEKNLRRRDGRWHWHWDPRLLELSGPMLDPAGAAEMEERLAASLVDLNLPTLLVRGAGSDVLSRPIADEFAELVPHARVVDVARAAHMVAGDDNDRFTRAVLDFLGDLAVPAGPTATGAR